MSKYETRRELGYQRLSVGDLCRLCTPQTLSIEANNLVEKIVTDDVLATLSPQEVAEQREMHRILMNVNTAIGILLSDGVHA